jgi:hypothetical protein
VPNVNVAYGEMQSAARQAVRAFHDTDTQLAASLKQ